MKLFANCKAPFIEAIWLFEKIQHPIRLLKDSVFYAENFDGSADVISKCQHSYTTLPTLK